jgi:hypothetical protein
MAFNDLLFNDFKKFIEENSSFSKKDLVSYISKSFDTNKTLVPHKKLLKLDKRVPTAYQLFMKKHLPELKAREDAKGDDEDKLNNRELFKEVAKLWKEQKVQKDDMSPEYSKHHLPPILSK